MRKYLALAVAGVMVFGVASFAVAHEGNQTIEASVSPKKLDKKKFKNVTLNTVINTVADPGADTLPTATQTDVSFPKNLKVVPDAVPPCEENLEGTTPEQAEQMCGDSKVSLDDGSGAIVRVGQGTLEADVQAFRGKTDTDFILHSYVEAFGLTTILPGKFVKSDEGKQFGNELQVQVPALAGGAAKIERFEVTTDKKSGYVKARCKSKTNLFEVNSQYSDHAPTTDQLETKCKQKKKKKKN